MYRFLTIATALTTQNKVPPALLPLTVPVSYRLCRADGAGWHRMLRVLWVLRVLRVLLRVLRVLRRQLRRRRRWVLLRRRLLLRRRPSAHAHLQLLLALFSHVAQSFVLIHADPLPEEVELHTLPGRLGQHLETGTDNVGVSTAACVHWSGITKTRQVQKPYIAA